MKISSALRALLDDREHPIYVLITNVLVESDRQKLKTLGMRESKTDGDKVFVGSLTPRELGELNAKLDHRAKAQFERRGVPTSHH